MKFVPVKTPYIFKLLFPKYVWSLPTKEKVLYLTFDDGPTPIITDWTLDLLKKFNAKATFFCIGNNIEQYPSIFKRIENEGHAIGNHTYNHPNGWKTKSQDYLDEVLKTQKIITENFSDINDISLLKDVKADHQQSITNSLFRPPYGRITSKQGRALRKLGYKIIMWDILAFDWMDTLSKERCAKNVIRKTKSGSIIVFHDSVKASERMQHALPKVLEYFSEKGFEFRRIPE